ncbi:MAG: hypothetical protein SVZ03_12740 [Spirochaetota bacterium]|nr:hypothetical protein [Spirochaetota bacterium]
MRNRKNIFSRLVDLLIQLLERGYERFQGISLWEKIIFLNSVPGLIAIVLPVARYYIFGAYYYINNPLAVYMLGIIVVMLVSPFISGLKRVLIRVLLNVYYLFWVIYLPLAGELTKAEPHEISFGYYLNIFVPSVYILFSVFSHYASSDPL